MSALTTPEIATHKILDGKKTADACLESLKQAIQALDHSKRLPKLVVLLVGDNPASHVYVNKKAKVAQQLGMQSEVLLYPADVPSVIVEADLAMLNQDPTVHGILVQMPLPQQLDSLALLSMIAPHKDVDGLHPLNLGLLMSGQMPVAKPCTPCGMMTLLAHYNIPVAGKHAVVIGRSNIVGKPMGMLLLAESATVTYCHSRTPDLKAVTREADIVVAAVGIPRLIGPDYLKPGAVVLDVGINRLPDGKLAGDVDFDAVLGTVSHITPVPGGVGPMTIATLMQNTFALFQAGSK